VTPITRTLPAQTHGRYLIWPGDPEHLLVGFHGYAEAAEAELRRLQSIPESQEWTLVSIQGLHRFYRNKGTEIVASWMTRQDRELAIEDNIVYALRVIETIQRELGTASKRFSVNWGQHRK